MERLSDGFLNSHPVELLLLGDLSPSWHNHWLTMIGKASQPPCLVIEFWPEDHILSEVGPISKNCVLEWEAHGYGLTCSILNALQVGGVVDRTWLVAARHIAKNLSWPEWHGTVIRPMQNCLKPVGIRKANYRPDYDTGVAQGSGRMDLPQSEYDAMLFIPGSLILIPRGTRRILNDEIARGLGVPKKWLGEVYPTGQLIRRTVALHIFRGSWPSTNKGPACTDH
jgi:hypothetical protein